MYFQFLWKYEGSNTELRSLKGNNCPELIEAIFSRGHWLQHSPHHLTRLDSLLPAWSWWAFGLETAPKCYGLSAEIQVTKVSPEEQRMRLLKAGKILSQALGVRDCQRQVSPEGTLWEGPMSSPRSAPSQMGWGTPPRSECVRGRQRDCKLH